VIGYILDLKDGLAFLCRSDQSIGVCFDWLNSEQIEFKDIQFLEKTTFWENYLF